MSNPKFLRLHKRIQSIGFALQGVAVFFKTQFNAWIQLLAAFLVCSIGFALKIDKAEWCWIVFVIALVVVTEMLNTALEFLTDLVSPSFHPLAKKIKDVAAGAVLVAAIASLVIAAIIFIPKLFKLH